MESQDQQFEIHHEVIRKEIDRTESLDEILRAIDEFREQVQKRDPNQAFRVWLAFVEHSEKPIESSDQKFQIPV